ncbi:double-stranded RNA-binding domain-containing protein [Artemisia annua]|uniref:Double-stranded RNA-binding domain-containing protein n=1 Tax=Artemisia annua TaxID=35608 RepID=A0A2U1PTS8_ARTAN|nr:double-stranded RNA-binding domain-containing protein [Artemisia annua]
MYKNQLQELAQRSCFNLPSYTCIREGPDHAPRFKAAVNFNGETYECCNYFTTLRQAEHSAAEVALQALASANRGSVHSLAARILDETGVYKNLLQEVSQRVGALLPTYTTFRSGRGHLPVFTCTVELADCIFTGEPAKNKKQAEKNAAMSAWSSLKLMAQQSESLSMQKGNIEEQEHVTVARSLQKFRLKARMSNTPFPIRFPAPKPKQLPAQSPSSNTSKILPLICPKTTPRNRPHLTTLNDAQTCFKTEDLTAARSHKFPAAEAAPYVPVRHFRAHHGIAPPVTIRNSIPVFSAPPRPLPNTGLPQPSQLPPQFRIPTMHTAAPPVTIRQAVPVFSAPNTSRASIKPVAAPRPSIEDEVNLKDLMKPLPVSSQSLEEKVSSVPVISTSSPESVQTQKDEESKLQDDLKELQI